MSRELPNRKQTNTGRSEWRTKKDTSPLAGEDGQTNLNHTESTTHFKRPLDRFLDALRSHGHQPKKAGDGWACRCPAHDDRKPSLSINTGLDGSVLIFCHTGCEPEWVTAAIGLGMKDLFVHDPIRKSTGTDSCRHEISHKARSVSDSGEDNDPDTRSAHGYTKLQDAIGVYERALGRHDDLWEYHDFNRAVVGVVLRWNTPAGKQIRPASLVNGQWTLTGMPAPRPLYGLPALIQMNHQSEDPVLVCEGEKAADAAIACGYTATTSPHGSKSAAKCDWSVLDGKHVVIVPDLDDAGDRYADDVVELSQGAASIRVIDLSEGWSELPIGGDLADVLALESGDTQGVAKTLDALIQQSSPELSHGQTAKNSEKTAKIYQPFPVHLLPGVVGSYIMQGSKAIGCDPSYIALPVLSMLAGAIGNTHEVRLKHGWTEPCVVWSCIVGKSGTCKSPAIALAFRPLELIQERMFQEYQQDLETSKQESGGFEGIGRAGNGSVPRPGRCIIDDATIEATIELISANPHGIVQKRDELAAWFDFERYSGSNSSGGASRWIELFHARPASVDRKTSESIFVPRAALSITGGTQPGILHRLLTGKNLESGLIARFLFAMPQAPSKRWTNDEIDPAVSNTMNRLVEALHNHHMCTVPPDASEEQPRPHIIELDAGATHAFGAFVDAHNESIQHQSEHIGAAWSKLECYVARLALIIHLVREASGDPTLIDPERIDIDSINAAIALVEWFKIETKRVYTILDMDQETLENQRAIEWISKNGGAVTVREFSRGLAMYNDSTKAESKLNELVGAGFGVFQGRKPRGRSQEFVLYAEYQSPAGTTVTGTSGPDSRKTWHSGTGASGHYQVHSTGEDH